MTSSTDRNPADDEREGLALAVRMRGLGFAVACFAPDELGTLDAREVEEAMAEGGADRIEFLRAAHDDGTDNTDGPEVPAEVHSDDGLHRADFDASAWFAQAADGEIANLVGCGFHGDYPADEVARFFERSATAEVFAHVDRSAVGFECSVDEDAAGRWLAVHRPHLLPGS